MNAAHPLPAGPLEATELRPGCYVVRPAGACGTVGWSPRPWNAVAVNARSAADALRKVNPAHVGSAWRLA